ncbi:hypothetical protein CANARDRAFT_204253 [[Candida] arabinofermentans NRRL YB-2248]|uniref:Protein FAF1 n=1 Tax=[Candida] arabinofermentans NRRL YB-2248 TaxID=983967 RepID=A0A1E4STS2_9ASCO|nr:hypothetical protein CANARDRAFT_204253 [[Candida] arabinofermentans NRRL YB-2248]
MAPIVVKFTDKYSPKQLPQQSKDEKKVLKSGKPISLEELKLKKKQLETQQQKQTKSKEDLENELNDHALDRLLSESHILTNTKKDSFSSGASLTLQTLNHENPIGNTRAKTLTNRIRSISSTNSKYGSQPSKLEKMPMSLRKGLIKSRIEKISKYEKDAKDAGIVLSKNKKDEFRNIFDNGVTSITDRIGTGIKKEKRIRDRGLKIQSVGRSTRNGLVISKDEIAKLTSSNDKGRRGKKGKRGGRGGKY